MPWSLPRVAGLTLCLLCMLASELRAMETESLAEIGLSFFEQPITAASDVEHLHYDAPPADLTPILRLTFELPPLPELPPPEPPQKLPQVEEVEKPTAESDATAKDADSKEDASPTDAAPEGDNKETDEKKQEKKPAADKKKTEAKPEKKDDAKEEAQEDDPEEEPEVSYGYLDYVPYGQYYHIDYWFGESKWSKSIELGLNGQTGNTESTSLRVGAKIRRDGPHTIFTADIRHLRTSNREGLTQNNAFVNHKLEWPLKIYENWSLFEKTDIEYDAFKAFDMRLVFNGGVSYKPLKTDRSEWTLSAGTGFSQEFGIPTEELVPEATLGTQLSHKVTDKQSFDIKFDYFPAFELNKGYRHVTDASYKIILDEGLSLKLSTINRYDSTPNGRKPNDLDYAVLLLYQF